MKKLGITDVALLPKEAKATTVKKKQEEEDEDEARPKKEQQPSPSSSAAAPAAVPPSSSSALPRGKRTKLKKASMKYGDQDDDERAFAAAALERVVDAVWASLGEK